MTHEPTEMLPTGETTAKTKRPIYRCPTCGKQLPNVPGRVCAGSADVQIIERLDCIHRLEKAGTVPCGTCAETGREKQVSVFLCRANGGQCCVLIPIGDVRFHDARPVVCQTCHDRKTEG